MEKNYLRWLAVNKPPIQFELKAILLATAAAAVLACLAVPGAQQIKIFTAIAVLAALATVAILAAAVLIAFGFSLSMLLYHAVGPLRDWVRSKLRPGSRLR